MLGGLRDVILFRGGGSLNPKPLNRELQKGPAKTAVLHDSIDLCVLRIAVCRGYLWLSWRHTPSPKP